MYRRPLVFALLLLPSAFGCSCGDPQPAKLLPVIGLYQADKPEAHLEEVDFRLQPINAKGPGALVVKAESRAQLTVKSVTFEDDDGKSAAVFRVAADETVPFVVGPLLTKELHLEFAPTDSVVYTARVVIASDDPEHPVEKRTVKGQGTEGEIRVYVCKDLPKCEQTVEAPDTFDMGFTYQGQADSTQVQIFNEGLDRLQVTSVEFEDPEAAAEAGFSLTGSVGAFSMAARSGKNIEVDFKPSTMKEPGTVSTTVVIHSKDRDEPEVHMPITATSLPNHPPVACIYVKRVERFEPGGGGDVIELPPGAPDCVDSEDTGCVPIIQPLDEVTIATDVRPGCTGDPDMDHASLLTRVWTVAGPDPATPDMGPAEYKFKTQISGIYTVALQVTDPLGLVGTADETGKPAELRLDVHPVADIAVEVSWGPDADPGGVGSELVDLDAHLMKFGASLLSPDDCAQRCENKQWGTPAADDNPRQLTDDDNGFGQLTETLLLNRPTNGQQYIAGAHFFDDHRQVPGAQDCNGDDAECPGDQACIARKCRDDVPVRVRIFIRGIEKKIDGNPEGRIILRHPCDFWYAASIRWNDGTADVRGISDTPGDVPGNTCAIQ